MDGPTEGALKEIRKLLHDRSEAWKLFMEKMEERMAKLEDKTAHMAALYAGPAKKK